ncbi:hypothetical protein KI387_006472, partial [Taxus chinensis]
APRPLLVAIDVADPNVECSVAPAVLLGRAIDTTTHLGITAVRDHRRIPRLASRAGV